ncbi:hypothetical protein F511_07526 [Dorcoceras hygrometricum]|uniref:Uncharacterized protein n=1 Tax=Dorcoceras hygrometricum TaxID=472368 RepID=A0A2Z7BAM3_9LAMI|nr:hypothetical protein F511_07526 [Dorcoceras hygrometricum]
MSSPSRTPVSSTAASIDSASPRRQAEEPWLPEPEELPNTPWYEEKSSNLKLSDIAIIKEKGGTMGKFEVVLPHPDERAHRPPPGFHTFYMNQIEMGLRFPIPRFIAALCHYIKRMGKAELLQTMQEAARASGEVAPPKKVTKKRKASSLAEKEARGEKRKKASASSSGVQKEEVSKKNRAPTSPTPTSEDSLVESPSAVAATRYICNMAPDWDLKVLRKADGAEAVAWGGEMVKRLTQAHRKVNASRQKFDAAMGQHAEVLARIEELEAHRAREETEVRIQREALEAELASEKEARAAEKAAREALEAELGEVKARAVQEAERLRSKANEEFLKSPEFNVLLGQRAWGFFKNVFWGCLAQFRANGYPEEEHPASFLDVQQALAEMGDEEEAEEEEEEEDEEGRDADDNPPPS